MTKVNKIIIDYDPDDLMTYKDMEKGQIFYDVESHCYGIKLSPARYYSFHDECVWGFCNNRPNDSDVKHYLPILGVQFVIAKCFWAGEKCIEPYCKTCAVKQRELNRRLQHEDTK